MMKFHKQTNVHFARVEQGAGSGTVSTIVLSACRLLKATFVTGIELDGTSVLICPKFMRSFDSEHARANT
jgi:hypothetical protein